MSNPCPAAHLLAEPAQGAGRIGVSDRAVRDMARRVIAALASRFRDLDLAEDVFSEACLKAARHWPGAGEPADPAAWLYRVAFREAVSIRRRPRGSIVP